MNECKFKYGDNVVVTDHTFHCSYPVLLLKSSGLLIARKWQSGKYAGYNMTKDDIGLSGKVVFASQRKPQAPNRYVIEDKMGYLFIMTEDGIELYQPE